MNVVEILIILAISNLLISFVWHELVSYRLTNLSFLKKLLLLYLCGILLNSPL